MALITLTKEEFQAYSDQVSSRSFMQSVQMGDLLEKRGARIVYLALNQEGEIQVAALVYSLPMLGGLHMEINSGPIYTQQDALPVFYAELKEYAKQNGVLELLVKPYETYQTFDGEGNPIDAEKKSIIQDLTDLGYQFDGLKTGYPGGEPDWLYCKDLNELTEKTLLNSFSKKGKALVKKADTFGIQLKKLNREELSIFKDITKTTSERREYSDKSLEYYEHFYDSFGEKAEFVIAILNLGEYIQNLIHKQKELSEKIATSLLLLEQYPDSAQKKKEHKELARQYESFEVRKAEARELIKKYGEKDLVLAGSLFIYMPQETTYLFSGSYTEFNKFYAPALLQKYVMLESIKRGIPKYNFLGIQGIFDGSDGVLRFKQNFNGYIVRKAGTFRYYPSPLKYKAIQLLKKILGR
ncbi:aminoacyltransferase [Streptococcus mitis]|uniref:Aminoacyltransferase FemA n=1 Tax=Streptococcus mitis TaxID=28037 RepID=A0A3R9IP84_STRMT|nr:aminoacyltransferase [Streptococcus mitis]MBZ2107508.1 aminoacyltransferase [Streptococcus mitis]MBZ2114771.1 aminoacyltransferase [Streptococcus mitis]RSI84560.1 Aminoacyltransferase FemA [Streptococcus mitis]RSI90306.1 Aminoacyltransferase FemA [Streptococcus mitis]